MLSYLRRIPQAISQTYRSAVAFRALNQLRQDAHQGFALDTNPALKRFAGAMQISEKAARDVYMGTLRTEHPAAFIVNAHKTLQGARWLARLSPSTATQAHIMLKEVRSAHISAVHETVKLTQDLVQKTRADGHRIARLRQRGFKYQARALQESRSLDRQQLSALTDELEVLSNGLK